MVLCILEDRGGSFWFGTFNSRLIRFRDEPEAKPTRYTTADGLSNNTVNALYQDREGILWIGTGGGGLNRLAPQFISGYSTAQGLSGNITHAVLADRAGNVWVATHVGLSKLTHGVVTNYSAANGLPLSALQALYEDRWAVVDRQRQWLVLVQGRRIFARHSAPERLGDARRLARAALDELFSRALLRQQTATE